MNLSADNNKSIYGDVILIAGIGNIFQGDDGFGCEVARRLWERTFAGEVIVRDFGIRGYDLAMALADGYQTVIMIDATSRGQQPGTLYVIEPDVAELDQNVSVDAGNSHSVDPMQAIQMALRFADNLPELLLVGCEPAVLPDPEDVLVELSEPVAAAIDEAIEIVETLVAERTPAVIVSETQ